jgi:hypothetical protein
MVDLSVELSGANLMFIITINLNIFAFKGNDLNWARLNGEDSELCLKLTEVFSVSDDACELHCVQCGRV